MEQVKMLRKFVRKVSACMLFAFTCIAIVSASATAVPIGPDFHISDSGCRFPDAAFDSTDGKYLVVWVNYGFSPSRVQGRFVDGNGSNISGIFDISEGTAYALYPAVTYNVTNNHFLVTWDDGRGDAIWGQLVKGSDGVLDGGNFNIGTTAGGARSSVAWSSTSNCYMVVYSNFKEVYGQRISNTKTKLGSEINISNDTDFSGYPSVGYGLSGNQFLVTWDYNPSGTNFGYIAGQRIDAVTGNFFGTRFPVSFLGTEDRSTIAYDSTNSRWLVQYQQQGNAGYSYDQYGQLVNANGTLNGVSIPIAHTPAFEGETLVGCDVCFSPALGRFFSSFQLDNNMGGQESSASVMPVTSQATLGVNTGGANSNTADTLRNRFMAVWENYESNSYYIHGGIYGASVQQIFNFKAIPGNNVNSLSWRNSGDKHFTGTMIRYKTSSYPLSPTDGTLLLDKANTPGSNDTFVHSGLVNGVTYYYSAFGHDIGPNYSPVAVTVSVPGSAPRLAFNSSTFNSSADGWNDNLWKSGPYEPGTMSHNDSCGRTGGGMRCTGAGSTDGNERCNREGGEIWKAISTKGFKDLLISYDIRTNNLGQDYTGGGSGSCPVDHNLVDEQLTILYSTDGGSSWNEAEYTARAVLTGGYQSYGTRQISLSGISGVDDNPSFTLKLRWQLNTATDIADIDNIVVMGSVSEPGSIASIKSLPDNTPVVLGEKSLYMKRNLFGYIEEKDRVSGIRIEGTLSGNEGDLVSLSGKMKTTTGGERFVSVDVMTSSGSGPVKPLAANNRNVSVRLLDGLFVRTWGRVVPGSVTTNSYRVSDGFNETGVKVITFSTPGVADGQSTTVSGAAGWDGSRVIYRK